MKRIGLIAAVGVLLVLSAHSAADSATQPTSPESKAETFLLVEVKGAIGEDFTAAKLKAAIAEARAAKVAVVVLSMDTPGGSVPDAEAIVNLIIENKDLRFIALVNKALSAGAAITLACKEIYVMETATIGAAVSYLANKRGLPTDLPADVAEKFQSAWRAVCRKAADHGGHSSLLAEGMVDRGFAITMRTVNGKVILERDGKGELVKAAGLILTLTAKEAVAYGLAKAVVPDVAVLGAKLGMPKWRRFGGVDIGKEDGRPTLKLTDLKPLLYKYANLLAGATDAAAEAHRHELKNQLIGRQAQLSGMLVNVVQSEKGVVVHVNYTLKKYVCFGSANRQDLWIEPLDVEEINIKMISEDNRWISARAGSRVVVDGRILDINAAGRKLETRWTDSNGKQQEEAPVTLVSADISMMESKPKGLSPRPTQEPRPAAPATVPVDPEAEAKQRLNLADTYVRNGMTAQALKMLRSIVEDFPNTAAAKKAVEQYKELEDEAKKAGKGS